MRASSYRKKIDKKILQIILGILAGMLLLGIITFIFYFKIAAVEVDGNYHYTDEEMKDMVLTGPFQSNAFLITFVDMNKKIEGKPFLQSVSVERTHRNKIAIHVMEKQLVGYVRYLDGYLYFDKTGTITESTIKPVEGIPFIEGLTFDHVALGEQLPMENREVFNTILSLTRMIQKNNIPPDRIVLGEKSKITLFYGTVQVNLGIKNYMEEKITHLTGILPEIKDMTGILHLEGVDADIKNITFEKTGKEIEKTEEETKK